MIRHQDLCCYHLENWSTHNYSWKQVWRSESTWAFTRQDSQASQDQAFLWILWLSKRLRSSNDQSAIISLYLQSQDRVDQRENAFAKQTISDVQSQASEDKEVSDWTSEQRIHFLQLRFIRLAHLIRWKERRKSAFLRWLQKAQCFDQTRSLFFALDRRDSRSYTRKQIFDSIEHHCCVQQTANALR